MKKETKEFINQVNRNMKNYDNDINLRIAQSDKIELNKAKQSYNSFLQEMDELVPEKRLIKIMKK